MTKPLVITSSRHAYGLFIYAAEVLLGFQFAIGISRPSDIDTLAGPMAGTIWALALMFGAGVALMASWVSPQRNDPERARRKEMQANIVLAVALSFFWVCVAVASGFDALDTQLLAFAFTGAALGRIWQTHHELARLTAAKSNPRKADDAYLAEPEDEPK